VRQARPGKGVDGKVMRDQRPRHVSENPPRYLFSIPRTPALLLLPSTTNSNPKDNEVTLHNVTSTPPNTIPSSRIMPQAIAEL